MQPGDLALIVDVDDRVVERSRRRALGDAEGNPHTGRLGGGTCRVEVWPIDFDGLVLKPLIPVIVVDSWHPPDEVGVPGDEGFGKRNEVRPVGAGLGDVTCDDVECAVAVEIGGCRLHSSDL